MKEISKYFLFCEEPLKCVTEDVCDKCKKTDDNCKYAFYSSNKIVSKQTKFLSVLIKVLSASSEFYQVWTLLDLKQKNKPASTQVAAISTKLLFLAANSLIKF